MALVRSVIRQISSGTAVPVIRTDVPTNVLTINGQPLTISGQYLTIGG
jgi:hypothetical protein